MAAKMQIAYQHDGRIEPRYRPAAPLSARALDFKIISSRDEFHALEDEWTGLHERAGSSRSLFQSYNWLWHWANHFLAAEESKGNRLAICTGRLDGRLVLVWPTLLEVSGPLRRLVWMGAPVSEYGDVLLDDVADRKRLLAASYEFLKSQSGADLLVFRKVAADAAVAELLVGLGCTKTKEFEAHYIDGKAVRSCRDIPALHSRRAGRMQMRKRQRFMLDGGSPLERLAGGTRAAELATRALAQRQLASGTAKLDGIAEFLADIARGETRPVGCEVSFLPARSGAAAIALGFHSKGIYLSYLVSFDAGCRKYTVGSLLMEDLMRRVCLEGGSNIDHLARETIFKMRWSNWTMPVYEFEQPASVLGRLYVMLRGGVIHHVARRTFQGATGPAA